MRTYTTPVALLALPAIAYAVTLNDFTPRVSGLPDACNKVYNQLVAGCKPTDFPKCSEACVNGLTAMTQPVKDACGNADVTGQNIIVAFLSGSGPGSLCVNAGDYLSATSSSAAPVSSAPPPTSTKSSPPATSPTSTTPEVTTTTSSITVESSSSSSSAASTSSESQETSTETVVAGTTTAIATIPSSTAIVMDTSSSPIASETATSTSSSGSEQTSVSDNSGGGSPFDTLGNLADHSGAATSLPTLSLVLTAAVAALALQW